MVLVLFNEGITLISFPLKEFQMYTLANILWTLIVLMVIFWVLGFALHIGGGLIHLILVIAVNLLVFNLLSGRGATL